MKNLLLKIVVYLFWKRLCKHAKVLGKRPEDMYINLNEENGLITLLSFEREAYQSKPKLKINQIIDIHHD